MRRILAAISLILTLTRVWALASDISFSHVGLKEGLTDTQITSITQDCKGFIWISTHCGLNRFDGYDMRTFVHDASDPASLPDKKMTSITGKTPIEFIRVIRLKRAAQYLRESQLTISEIAYMTGFNNVKLFRKYFKDEFGILPSEYQRSHQSPDKTE